jgi:tetratricopeptide (TPR) repeat protein
MLCWCSLYSWHPALVHAASKAEVEYARGILAYNEGDYTRAREHFRTTVALEPDNPHAQLYLGLSLSRLRAFAEAIAVLQKALQLDPSLAYIHYHLGLAFYESGRYAQAQEAFQTFLVKAPEGPEVRAARDNLDVISRRLHEQQLVQLQAALSFQYDDNVILEPHNEPFAFGRQADGRTVFTFVGRLLPVRTDPWLLGAEYALYQSLHFNLHAFDVQSHTGRLFARHTLPWVAVQVAADYTYTLLDNVRFAEEVTVQPSAIFQQTKALAAVVSVQYRVSNFFNQFIPTGQADVRDRDGWAVQPGIDQYLTFNQQRSRLRLSYAYEASRHDGTDWEYNSHRVGLGVQTPLWWGVTLFLDGTYLRRDYLHRNSFDAVPLGVLTADDRRARRDDRYDGGVALQRPLGRPLDFADLVLTAGFQHTNNISNLDFFHYRRNIVTVTLSGRY